MIVFFTSTVFIIDWKLSWHYADSEESQEPTKRRNRLGPAGLALHYANIISQIDTLVSSQAPLFYCFLSVLDINSVGLSFVLENSSGALLTQFYQCQTSITPNILIEEMQLFHEDGGLMLQTNSSWGRTCSFVCHTNWICCAKKLIFSSSFASFW